MRNSGLILILKSIIIAQFAMPPAYARRTAMDQHIAFARNNLGAYQKNSMPAVLDDQANFATNVNNFMRKNSGFEFFYLDGEKYMPVNSAEELMRWEEKRSTDKEGRVIAYPESITFYMRDARVADILRPEPNPPETRAPYYFDIVFKVNMTMRMQVTRGELIKDDCNTGRSYPYQEFLTFAQSNKFPLDAKVRASFRHSIVIDDFFEGALDDGYLSNREELSYYESAEVIAGISVGRCFSDSGEIDVGGQTVNEWLEDQFSNEWSALNTYLKDNSDGLLTKIYESSPIQAKNEGHKTKKQKIQNPKINGRSKKSLVAKLLGAFIPAAQAEDVPVFEAPPEPRKKDRSSGSWANAVLGISNFTDGLINWFKDADWGTVGIDTDGDGEHNMNFQTKYVALVVTLIFVGIFGRLTILRSKRFIGNIITNGLMVITVWWLIDYSADVIRDTRKNDPTGGAINDQVRNSRKNKSNNSNRIDRKPPSNKKSNNKLPGYDGKPPIDVDEINRRMQEALKKGRN